DRDRRWRRRAVVQSSPASDPLLPQKWLRRIRRTVRYRDRTTPPDVDRTHRTHRLSRRGFGLIAAERANGAGYKPRNRRARRSSRAVGGAIRIRALSTQA